MIDKIKAPTGCNPAKGSQEKRCDQVKYNDNQASLLTLAAHLTCRHIRLLKRLLTGPLPRIEADRVTGTTNAPEYISRLRHEFRIEIKTERVEVVDRDGFKTRPGVYHLQPESREKVLALLEVHEARRAA